MRNKVMTTAKWRSSPIVTFCEYKSWDANL